VGSGKETRRAARCSLRIQIAIYRLCLPAERDELMLALRVETKFKEM